MLPKLCIYAMAFSIFPATAQTLCNVTVSLHANGSATKLEFNAPRDLRITKKSRDGKVSGKFKFKDGALTAGGIPLNELTIDHTDLAYTYDEEANTFCAIRTEKVGGKYIARIEEYAINKEYQPKLLTESLELEGGHEAF